MGDTKQMTRAQVLSATLRLPTETLGEFAGQLKRLSADEKQELAEAAAKHLGVELVESKG